MPLETSVGFVLSTLVLNEVMALINSKVLEIPDDGHEISSRMYDEDDVNNNKSMTQARLLLMWS
jgi:hypothetical protein